MTGNLSPQTDIFALGLIAYTMLVGKPYWYEETTKAGAAIVFALHASKGPQESAVARAQRFGVQLPPSFDAWFFRATAAKPEDRFPSTTVAVMELATALGIPVAQDAAFGITGPTSRASVPSKLTSSGVLPPASVPRSPLQSVSGSFTPLQPVPTPIGSGLTTGTPSTGKKPFVAIAVAALVTLLLGGLVIVKIFAGVASETAASGSPVPPTEAAPFVPDVKPIATVALVPENTATAAQSAAPVKSAKTTKSTTTTAPAVRSTATAVKKPAGGVIWNND